MKTSANKCYENIWLTVSRDASEQAQLPNHKDKKGANCGKVLGLYWVTPAEELRQGQDGEHITSPTRVPRLILSCLMSRETRHAGLYFGSTNDLLLAMHWPLQHGRNMTS